MTKTEIIKQHCKQLNLSAISDKFDSMVIDAENNRVSYLEFIENIFKTEIDHSFSYS